LPKKRERSFHTLEIIPRKFRSFPVLPLSSRTAKRNEKPCRECSLCSDHLFPVQLVCSLKSAGPFLRFAFCLLPLQGSRVRWLAPTLPFGRGPSPPCIPRKQRRKGGSVFLFRGRSVVQGPFQKPANRLRPGLEPVFETKIVERLETQINKDNQKINSPKISPIRLYFPKRAESPPTNSEQHGTVSGSFQEKQRRLTILRCSGLS